MKRKRSPRLCPECKSGKLETYGTRKRSTGTIERRRRCLCCEYAEVVKIRPEEIISLRVVQKRTRKGSESMDTSQSK